jgi:hypothetical protein
MPSLLKSIFSPDLNRSEDAINRFKQMLIQAFEKFKADSSIKPQFIVVSGEQDPFVYTYFIKMLLAFFEEDEIHSNLKIKLIAGAKLMSELKANELKNSKSADIHPTLKLLQTHPDKVEVYLINNEEASRIPYHVVYCNLGDMFYAELPHSELVNSFKWYPYNNKDYPVLIEGYFNLLKKAYKAHKLTINEHDELILTNEVNNKEINVTAEKRIDYFTPVTKFDALTTSNNFEKLLRDVSKDKELTGLSYTNWYLNSQHIFNKEDIERINQIN